MRILRLGQLEAFVQAIGQQNVDDYKRALADGCWVWVFQNPQEVITDVSLIDQERQFCLAKFEQGETWVSILRQRSRPIGPYQEAR